MIIVRLKGGLGNQLFQYALGRRLAIKNNDVLKLDIRSLDTKNDAKITYRPYALSAFNIKASIATETEAERLEHPHGALSKLAHMISHKLLRHHHVGWEPQALQKHGAVYLDGYWQSPKYFEDIRETLLHDISPVAPLTDAAENFLKKIRVGNAVSLHIRRTDYVTNSTVRERYGICSLSYYERAVVLIESLTESPRWFVFSDDIAWAKANLPFVPDAIFVEGPGIADYEELWLMSQCKHNVIANSSFSWWAAWLNQNEHKTVIAPKPWFDYDPKFNRDIIPDTWTEISK